MKIKKYNYIVELHTELGKRKGELELYLEGRKIRGFLSLLKHKEPVIGKLKKDGNCELKGKIVTLIKEKKYTATGRFHEQELMLKCKMEAVDCLLTGTAFLDKI